MAEVDVTSVAARPNSSRDGRAKLFRDQKGHSELSTPVLSFSNPMRALYVATNSGRSPKLLISGVGALHKLQMLAKVISVNTRIARSPEGCVTDSCR